MDLSRGICGEHTVISAEALHCTGQFAFEPFAVSREKKKKKTS